MVDLIPSIRKWREGLHAKEIYCVRENEGGDLLLSSYPCKRAHIGEKGVDCVTNFSYTREIGGDGKKEREKKRRNRR